MSGNSGAQNSNLNNYFIIIFSTVFLFGNIYFFTLPLLASFRGMGLKCHRYQNVIKQHCVICVANFYPRKY